MNTLDYNAYTDNHNEEILLQDASKFKVMSVGSLKNNDKLCYQINL